jgi:hypothetical protein
MLARLKLSAVRERLDKLLHEAGRRELSLREGLLLPCEAGLAHRKDRRMRIGMGIAKFPFVRTLGQSEFELPCRNPNANRRPIKALDLVD